MPPINPHMYRNKLQSKMEHLLRAVPAAENFYPANRGSIAYAFKPMQSDGIFISGQGVSFYEQAQARKAVPWQEGDELKCQGGY